MKAHRESKARLAKACADANGWTARASATPVGNYISSAAYWAVLLVLWGFDLPIAVLTFAVFNATPRMTAALAAFTSALFLATAHFAGRTFRQWHDGDPSEVGLFARILGVVLFIAGVATGVLTGFVRAAYFGADGSHAGPLAVIFTSLLAVTSFLLATNAAWLHHAPLMLAAERASRKVKRVDKDEQKAGRRARHSFQNFNASFTEKQAHAQEISTRAERIVAGKSILEPRWLAEERWWIAVPVPKSPLLPEFDWADPEAGDDRRDPDDTDR